MALLQSVAEVEYGDDYTSLGTRYGVDPIKLKKKNKSATPVVGMKLELPEREDSRPTYDPITKQDVNQMKVAGSGINQYEDRRQQQVDQKKPSALSDFSQQLLGIGNKMNQPPDRGGGIDQYEQRRQQQVDQNQILFQATQDDRPNIQSSGPTYDMYTSGINDFEARRQQQVDANREPYVLEGSGTFSQNSIDKWANYYKSPYNSNPAIDQYVQHYTAVYEAGLQDMAAGQLNAYGELNAPHIPNALLSTIDVASLDPDFLEQYGDQLEGLSHEQIVATWLSTLGYEISEQGNYMEYNPNKATDGGGGSSGGGGYGGYRRYGRGGGGGGWGNGGSYGNQFYDNAVTGLLNWRGVGYA